MDDYILTLGMDAHYPNISIASGYQNCNKLALRAKLTHIRSGTS